MDITGALAPEGETMVTDHQIAAIVDHEHGGHAHLTAFGKFVDGFSDEGGSRKAVDRLAPAVLLTECYRLREGLRQQCRGDLGAHAVV